ncbi:MAG: hypothetical protein ABSB61_01305 [Anaerolineales bacterium]
MTAPGNPHGPGRPIRPFRLLAKTLILFVLANLGFATANPSGLGRISAYNLLVPGRERFPFGENSGQFYNLSLYDVDAMFASHVLSAGSKPADQYRVLILGDSSVWGLLLKPEDTVAGLLNTDHLAVCGKPARFYNLGYPTISLVKDLMILDQAADYQPDLILWFTTLQAFPLSTQLASPVVANNAPRVRDLIARYHLGLDPNNPAFPPESFWSQTIIGRRRDLADLVRLQLYGVMWAATGVDQVYPASFTPAQRDFEPDASFNGSSGPTLQPSQLAFGVLAAGQLAAGKVPILLVNEPILMSSGKNSDIRYNLFYPRWAYDQYRLMLSQFAKQIGWPYLDVWDTVPASEFTNSPIHLTVQGESILAEEVSEAIHSQPCS